MYKSYIKKIKKICKKKRLLLKQIGKGKKYPLFSILNKTNKPKKTICFVAGVHGDEIAGPLAVYKFLENYNFNKIKNIKIIILPVVNPFGFERKKRVNSFGEDINRLFCEKVLKNENKIVYDFIKKERINFILALHEDLEEGGFYMYIFEKKKEKIYRDIMKLAKKFFRINNNKTIMGSNSSRGFIINPIDKSLEYKMYHEGVLYSICAETPGKESIKKRIDFYVKLMEKIIKFNNV